MDGASPMKQAPTRASAQDTNFPSRPPTWRPGCERRSGYGYANDFDCSDLHTRGVELRKGGEPGRALDVGWRTFDPRPFLCR